MSSEQLHKYFLTAKNPLLRLLALIVLVLIAASACTKPAESGAQSHSVQLATVRTS